MKKRATLKDIATALNVSVATVSRALNNKEDIGAQTKLAVTEVARMLDYKPNVLAVSLRKNTANKLIGVILPSVDHYFYSTILNGIMNAAKQGENLIIIGESNQDPVKEAAIIEMFADYFVSGIILTPSKHDASNQNVKEIVRRGISVVLLDRTLKTHSGSFVQYDDFNGGRIATEHLILQGRKHIAHIRGDASCSIASERFRGYRQALLSHNIKYRSSLVLSAQQSNEEEGYLLMNEIFAKNDVRPDAVFAVTDDVAAGVYRSIHQRKLRIPEDIAVVGYSNSKLSNFLNPKLTSVEQNGRSMGQTACEILTEVIENKSKTIQKTYGAHLMIRESSRISLTKS